MDSTSSNLSMKESILSDNLDNICVAKLIATHGCVANQAVVHLSIVAGETKRVTAVVPVAVALLLARVAIQLAEVVARARRFDGHSAPTTLSVRNV